MTNYAGKFYLGKIFDPKVGEVEDKLLTYDPDDLTTHAVAVGMTGSGKTGLCIDLLEEAALNGIPALMIDPKGDMTNTLLHFPDLLPEDFKPWVNPDQARKEGKTLDQAAAEAANLWKNGLADWDIDGHRIRKLADAAQFSIYTPGSEAGIPVNILSSLKSPELSWEEHREVLRDKISGTVMGLLGLVGLKDIDPVRSEEHILLSNIFERAWSKGQDLNLRELILQIQNPPFEKLGVIDIETFMPEKDRLDLSMMLNNILAAPGFQSWITGQPLEVGSLLYTPEGRPRHSVFYIAHLTDAERMFFVTLLYSAVETWMRAQKGTTSLRALIYFDEIYGYLPPVANPPSKIPMLRMLKQARAFGVGQVLVTQNPVDVDYKALSNAGTWFIGKLQTEQDKNRLLEGLEGAAPGMEKDIYDRLISTLGKRMFLLHNVHEKKPVLFYTRWAMNYLTGPLTRNQIPALNELAGAGWDQSPSSVLQESTKPGDATTPASGEGEAGKEARRSPDNLPGTLTPPKTPGGIDEYYYPPEIIVPEAAADEELELDDDLQQAGIIYRPFLVAQSNVRFLKRNYNLDYEKKLTVLVAEPDRKGRVDWEEWLTETMAAGDLQRSGLPDARFYNLEPPLNDAAKLKGLEADFKDWIYHTLTVTVRSVDELDIFAGPQVSQGEFRKMVGEAVRKFQEEEIQKINDSYTKKLDQIKARLIKEERELEEDQTELSQRKMEELGTHAENLLSLIAGRRKRVSTSLTKRRMTSKAKADVKESLAVIDQYQEEILELEEDRQEAVQEEKEKWQDVLQQAEEILVQPYKKDILIELFGVVWYPYYLIQQGRRWTEVPAFKMEM